MIFFASVLLPRPYLHVYRYFHMCVKFFFSHIFFMFLHFL